MDVSSPPGQVFRFGDFEANLRSGELRRNGLKVKLGAQSFQVLGLLLENPGEVVTREELRQKLWTEDTFVDFEAGLNSAIKRLRDTLGDNADRPRFVETLPRRGYRFIASVDGYEAAVVPAVERLTSRKPLLLLGTAAAALLLGLLVGFNTGGLRDRLLRAGPPRIESLAVLPLENLSNDASQEYFVDGMTDELTTQLAKLGSLRVISRASAMQYKGQRKPLRDIARELGVDAVVEGSVSRDAERVRIRAQLIDARTDQHLWAESYERDLRDTLALQAEVARDIAGQVHLRLSPRSQAALARRRRVDPEALDAYLRGRYELNKTTAEGIEASIQHFERALEKDARYAEAWSGLSDSYSTMSLFQYWPPPAALPKAKAAALKALELDETLSETHVSLATALFALEWDRSGAEKELQRAIALDSNNARAHYIYGRFLLARGRFDDALAAIEQARRLDPLSPNIQNGLGVALYRTGRYDEALEQFRAVPDPDANSERRHRRMAAIYERKGMHKEALDELLTALRWASKKELAEQVEQEYLAAGYAEAKKTFLWGNIAEGERRAKHGEVTLQVAADYALLGEKDKAFEWLEKAYQARAGGLLELNVDDQFEPLRSDPRFSQLLRRVGLSPP